MSDHEQANQPPPPPEPAKPGKFDAIVSRDDVAAMDPEKINRSEETNGPR